MQILKVLNFIFKQSDHLQRFTLLKNMRVFLKCMTRSEGSMAVWNLCLRKYQNKNTQVFSRLLRCPNGDNYVKEKWNYRYHNLKISGSNLGTRKAIDAWGDNLRTWYDRTSAFRDSDLFITHMGYNTNAGAYYYYNREGDMNYEDTMVKG